MKKINTNKKLRISNNQTKIINEDRQPDEFDDLVDASGVKEVGAILKNLGMTAAAITKLSLKLSVVPIASYLKGIVWDGKEISFEQFKADWKKLRDDSFKTLGSEIDDLVKDHEGNFNNMLGDIGLSKSEANALLAVGSPPLAILNKLYDLSKSKLSGKERFDSKFKDIKEIKNLFRNIIYAYITGKNALTDEDSSKLLSSIDTEFNRYFGKVFPKDSLKIIENLHVKETYERHFKPIKNILSSAYDSFDFDSDAISSINNAPKNIDIDNIVKELNTYFTKNKYKNELSYKKFLNLNTMLITEDDKNAPEGTFEAEEIRRIGILFTFIYINKNTNEMKSMIIKENNNIDIIKFVNALKDRDTVIKHAAACYVKSLTQAGMIRVGKDYLEDPDNYTKNEISKSLDDLYTEHISGKFSEKFNKKIIEALESHEKTLRKELQNNNSIDECMTIISAMLKKESETEEKAVALFDWQKFGDSGVFDKFFKVNFLSEDDFQNLKNIQYALKNTIDENEKDGEKISKEIQEYITKKTEQQQSK